MKRIIASLIILMILCTNILAFAATKLTSGSWALEGDLSKTSSSFYCNSGSIKVTYSQYPVYSWENLNIHYVLEKRFAFMWFRVNEFTVEGDKSDSYVFSSVPKNQTLRLKVVNNCINVEGKGDYTIYDGK